MTDKKYYQDEKNSDADKSSRDSREEGGEGRNSERASKAELYSRQDKFAENEARNKPKKP